MTCINPWINPQQVPFPCRKCLGCLIDRKATTTLRIILESQLHPDNGFLTLTYDDEHLPKGSSLQPSDPQLFLKRFRKAVDQQWPGRRIRFFEIGEYPPSKGERPHYHFILFGIRCGRGYRQRTADGGWLCMCNECQILRSAWSIDGASIGFSSLQEYDQNRALYIASYMQKMHFNPKDPWLRGRHPEFIRRSNKPGIGFNAIPQHALAWKDREAKANSVGKHQLDVPTVHRIGKLLLPADKNFINKHRAAVGLPEETPPHIRAQVLLKNWELCQQALDNALMMGGTIQEHTKKLIHDREIQRVLNKAARARFPRKKP